MNATTAADATTTLKINTRQRFLSALKKNAEQAEWCRTEGILRCTINGRECCPITFLSAVLCEKKVTIHDTDEVTDCLGMTEDLETSVITASDLTMRGVKPVIKECDEDLKKYRDVLADVVDFRIKMEVAVGLRKSA